MCKSYRESFNIIVDNEVTSRLDKYISSKIDISRSKISKLIKDGDILVNNHIVRPNYRVRRGDVVLINLPEPEEIEITPANIPLDIIYEDEFYIAINKKPGIVVHPGAGNFHNTLVSGLLNYTRNLSKVGGEFRPGIVHRLDKDTSGVLIVAKSDEAHWKLSEMFANRQVHKEYLAYIWGTIRDDHGVICKPIDRSKKNRKKFVVSEGGKEAITEFNVIKKYNCITYVSLILKTGRTHQARVHMKYIGHPIVGDREYGCYSFGGIRVNRRDRECINKIRNVVDRHLLHAYRLKFFHPFFEKDVSLVAPIPEDFEMIEKILKECYNT